MPTVVLQWPLRVPTRAFSRGAAQSISSQSFAIASALVLMAGITMVVYIRTQWGVTSAKELGDKLREKGAKQKESLEQGSTVNLVRRISQVRPQLPHSPGPQPSPFLTRAAMRALQTADTTVKANVELVRTPTHHMGAHFSDTFKGGVMQGQKVAAREGGAVAPAGGSP